MDYKELIKDLRGYSRLAACNGTKFQMLTVRAATAIETLLAERGTTEWISVKDKLPEYDEPIIGCDAEMMDIGLVNYISGDFSIWMETQQVSLTGCRSPRPPDRERAER